LAGGLIGIPVALFSGVLISQNRAPEFFYTLIPAMLAAAAILYPWARRGKLARGQLLAGLIVLLINLLAAGSLGFPSVAVTVWAFVALTLNMSNESQRVLRVSRLGSVVVLICACIIVVACHQTLYRPVLTRLGAMGELPTANDRESEAILVSAAEADPFSAQPWLSLSGLYFKSWQRLHRNKADQEEVDKSWERFEFAADRIRTLSPRSSQRHMQIGNLHLVAYQVSQQREKLDAALEWYQEGISLYPNNALLHVQLAWAWDLAGNETQAIDAAKRAGELDGLNPHPELKLKNRVIFTGLANEASGKKAEQVVNELRKREMGN
jgi:tetratricopeptide (TPR) repeat protein